MTYFHSSSRCGSFSSRTIAAILCLLVCLTVAGLCITLDLGRPDRAILMVLKAQLTSPLIWDFAILTVMSGLAAMYLFFVLRVDALRKEMWIKALHQAAL